MPWSFSICIPNYNYAKYIGETIRSVLAQTYPHFEIIVADNASTDESVKVVESFKDDRIRIVRNRYNIGFAPNLQRATMFARNDFLLLLSSDDLIKPTALEAYARVLAQQGDRAPMTVLVADTEVIDGAGQLIYPRNRPFIAKSSGAKKVELGPSGGANGVSHYLLYRGRDVLRETLRNLRTFAPFLTVTYPRALWEGVEGYNCIRTIGPDKFFNYKLLATDPDVVYVPDRLFQYRFHGSVNFVAIQKTLKQQIDDYLYTIEYSESFLKGLDLTQDDLVREFIDRVCLKAGISQMVHGGYTQGFKMLMFALASYPGRTFKQPKAYGLLALLALGPLGPVLARVLYRLRAALHAKSRSVQSPLETMMDSRKSLEVT